MKYLKKYNESKSDGIKEFCEYQLAYLLDEGFKINVVPHIDQFNPGVFFSIKIEGQTSEDGSLMFFKWDDVKDQMIPFTHHLLNKYQIKTTFAVKTGIMIRYGTQGKMYQPEISNILDDKVDVNHLGLRNIKDYMYEITILVKEKYS